MKGSLYKIQTTCEVLMKHAATALFAVEGLEVAESGYKTGNEPPKEGWKPYYPVQGEYKHFWVRGTFKTPAAEEGKFLTLNFSHTFDGKERSAPHGLLYLNGKMIQGVDTNHLEAFLDPDTDYELVYYVYNEHRLDPVPVFITVNAVDTLLEGLYYDLWVPYEGSKYLNENTAEYRDTISVLDQACNIMDLRAPLSEKFYASARAAKEFLKEEFYGKLCSTEGKPIVNCIGHTHIDVEWRWARAQTREKMQRSFTSAARLMEKYPEYQFSLSQPELYRYLKEDAPEAYEELKALVAEGRWEPEGAFFLECDCNLVSGEGFARQLLQGKRFFKKEFGKDSRVLFLPDVFGYSAALPQLLKKAGVDYFITSKISWNDTNQIPYDMFLWEGIDGTELFSTFITAQKGSPDAKSVRYCTYVGTKYPAEVKGTWERFQQKEYSKQSLLTYGYGDGGGGPTRKMLEIFRRTAFGLPGYPVTKMNQLIPYLEAAEAEFKENTAKLCRAPKWVGELYLEYHRGTYTSQAATKRGNRKSEFLLQKAEGLSAIHHLLGGDYDEQGLYAAWRKVLHNQFHDILPGSSIHEVYEGVKVDYQKIAEYGEGVVAEKLDALTKEIKTDGGMFVYNPMGFARKGAVSLHGKTYELKEEIPAFGWKVLPAEEPACKVKIDSLLAENDFYILKLDEAGRIDSLFDKSAGREVFLSGQKGNEFQIFEDHPHKYDAWELDCGYKAKMYLMDEPAKIEPIFEGSRAGFKISRRYMNSTLEQKLWLYSEGRRIDFENELDWHEQHQVLKIAFPFDLLTDEATFEIQFGHLKRPTHSNTSWDQAKFEVCAHKWADLSEHGYGVALLNDCKYGFNTEGSTLKLTALKCPTHPDESADQGKHLFTYALLPHEGSLYEGNVIEEAYDLNQPMTGKLLDKQDGSLADTFSLVSCDKKNIIIEAVKKAEESEDLIVRLYDSQKMRTTATITLPDGTKKAWLANLIEEKQEEVPIIDGKVTLPVKNFEIITLRLER